MGGTLRIVKSVGCTRFRSSHRTGKETGAPGRARTEYGAAMCLPGPIRVKSRNTRPPRSLFRNSVVTRSGSRSATRSATRRAAHATSA